MKLLRYEDPETLIHTYGLSDDKKHDIDHLQMNYDRVVL